MACRYRVYELQFEDVHSNSHKFYRTYEADGASGSGIFSSWVQWGRIGAKGQWQEVTRSVAADKRYEKQGKGYVETHVFDVDCDTPDPAALEREFVNKVRTNAKKPSASVTARAKAVEKAEQLQGEELKQKLQDMLAHLRKD